MKTTVMCFLFLFGSTILFAQVAAFSGKDTDVVIDSVKLASDAKAVTVSVDISVVLPTDPTAEQKYTVEDANGGTLVSNKDYMPFPKTNLVFSPGTVLRQVVTLKIKEETNIGTITLCLKDGAGGLISLYTINVKRPADNLFKSLSVSIGGGLDLGGSNPTINGLATDIRLFSPDLANETIDILPFPIFQWLYHVWPFSYLSFLNDVAFPMHVFNASGFGFEAGIYNNKNVPPPGDLLTYTHVYTLNDSIANTMKPHSIVTEQGTYKRTTNTAVTGLYFQPYFRIWDLGSSSNLVTKASIYFSPRFELDSRIYDYSSSNLVPQVRDTVFALVNRAQLNTSPSDSIVRVLEGYVGYFGLTLHVVLEQSLDFHIGYTKSIVTNDIPDSVGGWATSISVFFEEKNSGLSISAEIRFRHDFSSNFWSSVPEIIFPSKSTESYYTLNFSKRFSLQKFADIIFGSGN